ncbi:MAG: hypothetical protein Q8908_16195, partial [Bacteroidota bacterium]|nr:hypothetical protein [Bacteroidota bacterium]
MKITKYKKQLIIALHLLFWFVSINAWSVVFNPGVESVSFIKGLQDYWPYLVLANGLFYLYCLLPFIWLSPKTWKWVKILLSVAFLIPLLYIVYQYHQPPAKRADLSLFTDYFIANFGYTVVFHLTIVAAVYFNLKVLIIRLLNRNKFGLYLLSFVALTCIAAVLNFVLFDYVIDQAFP